MSLTKLSADALRLSPPLGRMRATLTRVVRVMAAIIAGAEEEEEGEGGGGGGDVFEGGSVASSSAASHRGVPRWDAATAARAAYAAAGGGQLRATTSLAALVPSRGAATATDHAGAEFDDGGAEGDAPPLLPGGEGALVECVALVREALGERLQFNFRRAPAAAAQLLVPLRVLADAASLGVSKRSGAAADAVARLAAALAALEAYARQHASVSVLFHAAFAGGGGGGQTAAATATAGGESSDDGE